MQITTANNIIIKAVLGNHLLILSFLWYELPSF